MDSKHETLSDKQKLALLRKLTREGFDALDQGEGLTLFGEKQLSAAIAKIGRGAARPGPRRTGT